MRLLAKSLRRRWAPLLDARGPRTRMLVARVLEWTGLVPGSMERLARQFQREGECRRAMTCWEFVRRAAPLDPGVLASCLSCAIGTNDGARVRWLYAQTRDRLHLPPSLLVWLTGELIIAEDWSLAGVVLSDWRGAVGSPRAACARMPSLVSPLIGAEVDSLPRRVVAAVIPDATLLPELARVVFSFGHPVTAAALYRRSGLAANLAWLDRVAMCHGEAVGGCRVELAQLDELANEAAKHPDALLSLAYAALVSGRMDRCSSWVRAAVQVSCADVASLAEILDAVEAMLDVLITLRSRQFAFSDAVLEAVASIAAPIPKRFVCGFGWSGSGAVYDAVREHAGFAEFEGAGADELLNADSETEVTFIQSRAGLGELWMRARSGDGPDWQALWDLFRCHVVGLCPIGYSEYKGAAAANRHLHKYGGAYARIFRDLYDRFAALVESPRRGGLHELMLGTTEALCRMLLDRTGGKVVLFNNAVFGRNAIMLEIFAGHRTAIVYRDPLDVYADRLRSDKNHWRNARQMAEFYDRGLTRYLDYKASTPSAAPALREVPFERFVEDAGFRKRVKRWLLEGVEATGTSCFDPHISCRNIGIEKLVLEDADRRQLATVARTRQRMDQLADTSWRDEDVLRRSRPRRPSLSGTR